MADERTDFDRARLRELADRSLRRGYQLRHRRRALLVASPALAVALVVAAVVGLGGNEPRRPLHVTGRPGTGETSLPSTSVVAGPGTPGANLPTSSRSDGGRTPTRSPAPASAGTAVPGRVAFGGEGVYVVNPDGSGLRSLAPAGGAVAWSPDAQHLAFVRSGDSSDIVVVSVDGSGTRVIATGGAASRPAWSPDGRRIAYAKSSVAASDVYVANVDGSGERAVTSNASASEPEWSPNGRRIAFASGTNGISVVAPDGTGRTQLTPAGMTATGPRWSPDGERIVFSAQRQAGVGGTTQIWTVRPDGTALATVGAAAGFLPAWSPDGASLTYAGYGADAGIHVVRADGTGDRLLAGSPVDGSPGWSPDGAFLVFTRNNDVWVMTRDGADQHRVAVGSRSLGPDPTWSPR